MAAIRAATTEEAALAAFSDDWRAQALKLAAARAQLARVPMLGIAEARVDSARSSDLCVWLLRPAAPSAGIKVELGVFTLPPDAAVFTATLPKGEWAAHAYTPTGLAAARISLHLIR